MSLRGTVVKIVTTAPPALWSYIHRFASRSSRYTRSAAPTSVHRVHGSNIYPPRRAGYWVFTPRGDPRDRRLSFKTRRQHGCVGTANARRPTRCSRVVSPEATGSARSAAVQQRERRASRAGEPNPEPRGPDAWPRRPPCTGMCRPPSSRHATGTYRHVGVTSE